MYEIISRLNSPRNSNPIWAASFPDFSSTCFPNPSLPWFSARLFAKRTFVKGDFTQKMKSPY